jgi:hypothetical protein
MTEVSYYKDKCAGSFLQSKLLTAIDKILLKAGTAEKPHHLQSERRGSTGNAVSEIF